MTARRPARNSYPRDVATCPVCGSDLEDEAFAFWCPTCQREVSYAEVAPSRGDRL